MKRFTVKDFIAHNNPCINCNDSISIKVATLEDNVDGPAFLRPTVSNDFTLIDLKVTYTKTLKLWIFHQNNKFIASSVDDLKLFLKTHRVYLRSHCERCYTNIESHFLDFELDKGYIKPMGISMESVFVTDDAHRYHLHSSFATNETIIIIDRINKVTPISPMRFEVPLIPLSKFRDKEHLINKMKTYLVFS